MGQDLPLGLAMRRRWRRAMGLFRVREMASLTNVYSGDFAPVGPCDGEALRQWAMALAGEADTPDRIRFDCMDRLSAPFGHLTAGLDKAGFWVETVRQFSNWYVPVGDPSEFDGYWAERPSSLRHTVERKHRTLRRQHAVSLDIFWRPEHAETAIRVYGEVDGQSWKGLEPYPRFMSGLIKAGLAVGGLRVGLLRVDGEAVAVQVWLEHGRQATIFKLSYAERFKRLSVGSILTYSLIRDAFERGSVDVIDFGRGDDAYKRDWLPLERERWGIFAYNRSTVRGQLLAARNLLPKLARRLSPAAG
jgi:Acetyltransferase (GNAT) domain